MRFLGRFFVIEYTPSGSAPLSDINSVLEYLNQGGHILPDNPSHINAFAPSWGYRE